MTEDKKKPTPVPDSLRDAFMKAVAAQDDMALRQTLKTAEDAGMNVQDLANTTAEGGENAFHIIARSEKRDPVVPSILHRSGTNVNRENREGRTPLDMALYARNATVYNFLQAVGAKPGHNQKTPKYGEQGFKDFKHPALSHRHRR